MKRLLFEKFWSNWSENVWMVQFPFIFHQFISEFVLHFEFFHIIYYLCCIFHLPFFWNDAFNVHISMAIVFISRSTDYFDSIIYIIAPECKNKKNTHLESNYSQCQFNRESFHWFNRIANFLFNHFQWHLYLRNHIPLHRRLSSIKINK